MSSELHDSEAFEHSRPRILIVVPSLTVGGTERMALNLIKYTEIDGEFIVLVLFNRISLPANVVVRSALGNRDPMALPSSLLGRIGLAFRLGIAIKSEVSILKPDVILMTAVGPSLGVFLIASSPTYTRRTILRVTANPFETLHSNVPMQEKLLYSLEALAAVVMSYWGHVIFPANYLKAKFESVFGIPLPKATIIRNFLNPIELETLAAEPLESWPRLPVIVAVGRLVPQKNYPLMIQAFARVRAGLPCKLLIIGKGILRPYLVRLAESLGVSNDISLLGQIDNPFKYIKRSTLFVQTSNTEGMPNSLLEAMALGIPIVSTDCEGAVEALGNKQSAGLLVPRNDVNALSVAILKVLRDDNLQRELSRMSKSRSIYFGLGPSATRFMKLIDEIRNKDRS